VAGFDAIRGEEAPGLYPQLPLSDTILEMETVEEDEQVVMPGPSTAVESVPATPAQVYSIIREELRVSMRGNGIIITGKDMVRYDNIVKLLLH